MGYLYRLNLITGCNNLSFDLSAKRFCGHDYIGSGNMSRYGAIPDMSASYGNTVAALDAKEGYCKS